MLYNPHIINENLRLSDLSKVIVRGGAGADSSLTPYTFEPHELSKHMDFNPTSSGLGQGLCLYFFIFTLALLIICNSQWWCEETVMGDSKALCIPCIT